MGKNSCTSTLKNLLSKTTVHNELQVQPPMKLSKLTDNPLIPTLTRGTEAEQQIDSSEPKPRSKKRTLSQSKTIYAGDSQGEKRAQDVVDTHQIQDPDYERLLIGHVPITKISSYYTQRLSGHLKEDEDGDGEQTGNSIKGLDKIFSVGQWIRCL
ncbi:hypothetical protein H4Q26_014020 [Puccinia striiformis f. sp. tritici PST-130]|nr:hypothetical protein H4Q26_014020 [Puccinia striiformis f. sp. tritici PST-130]